MATDIVGKAVMNVLKKEKGKKESYIPNLSEEELKEYDDLGGMNIKHKK